MSIRIAFSNHILPAASSCVVWFRSLAAGGAGAGRPTLEVSSHAGMPSARRSGGEDYEEMLLLVRAYIALVDRESMRRFACRRDRFAYEAAIILHQAERRFSSQDAHGVLAVYAERTHGGWRGKGLLRSFAADPRHDVQRQALEDLTRFVVRRHRARNRAA